MSKDINFSASKEDSELIRKIVDRADKLYKADDKTSLMMDLTACHLNGCPLDLEKLHQARPADLMHDIWGINAYLNRNTGRLKKCFHPRCAKPEGGAA